MKNAKALAAPFQEVSSITGGMITGYNNHKGLTKREHFAAMAMQGIIQNHGYENWNYLASDAVAMADALLAELEK